MIKQDKSIDQSLQIEKQEIINVVSQVIPETVGFDSCRLSRIHAHIGRCIHDQKIAGAASIVARDRQVVHFEVQGFADIEAGKLLEKNAIFRLASMTKPIIGVAVLILMEKGRIRLDDPISKFIPEYQNMKVAVSDIQADTTTLPPYTTVPASREITIRDLLSHSSGLGQGVIGFAEMLKLMPKPGDTLASHIPLWVAVPLDFQPGTQTGYSPLAAFNILGRIVEIASGLPLDQFLSRFVFQPLGMIDTTFAPSDSQWQRVVIMYENTDQGLARSLDQKQLINTEYFSGAGGLLGTLEDYFRFVQMLANGGELNGRQILSPRMVQLMRSVQLPETIPGFPRGETWGLSVRVISDGSASGAPLTTGSFGWSGAWGTHFWIDPQENLVALIMINLANAGGAGAETAREFEMAVMQSIVELRSKRC